MRHEGERTGNGAQVLGLAAKLSNTADKRKLFPEVVSVEERFDVFRHV